MMVRSRSWQPFWRILYKLSFSPPERTRKIYAYFRKCWHFSHSEIWQCCCLRCAVHLSFLSFADYTFAQNLFHTLSALWNPIPRPQLRRRRSHTAVQHLSVAVFYHFSCKCVILWENDRSVMHLNLVIISQSHVSLPYLATLPACHYISFLSKLTVDFVYNCVISFH